MKRKAVMDFGGVKVHGGQETALVNYNVDGSVSVWVVIDRTTLCCFFHSDSQLSGSR